MQQVFCYRKTLCSWGVSLNLREFLRSDQVAPIEVSGLSEVSSEIKKGDAFIGVGAPPQVYEHISEAEKRGAACILLPEGSLYKAELSGEIPRFNVPNLHSSRGELASRFFGDPSANLDCTGVTGTNGKTSIAFLVADISDKLGQKAGYCGTLGWGSVGELRPTKLTTPDPVTFQKRLSKLSLDGCLRVAVELSSHALEQGRARGASFKTGVFSNLTREHLDYHVDMESYARSKARLFEEYSLVNAVICVDDELGRRLAKSEIPNILTYGANGEISWKLKPQSIGYSVAWSTPWGHLTTDVPYFCEFSVSNLAAAIGVLLLSGVELSELPPALENLTTIPGRVEKIDAGGWRSPTVIVDFGHTPSAIERVLKDLAKRCSGKLICVLGCGGDRDRGKRPIMGLIAGKLSDAVWLTSDNPRSECPQSIIDEIKQGFDQDNFFETVDREEAIRGAIRSAAKDDIIVVLGKGNEVTQEIKGALYPFNDKEVAGRILGEK